MTTKIYTLKKDDNGHAILLINGAESICPFQPAVATPVQNALGQVNIQLTRFCCSTQCPLANIFEDYDEALQMFKTSYQVDCTGTPVIHEIEEPTEPENDNKIII